MKKLFMITLCAFSCSTFAGFNPDNSNLKTIEQAEALPNNSTVVLEGYIVSQAKKKEFYFKDTQNKLIRLKIEDHIWHGLDVSPNTKVRIQGKIDKYLLKSHIEVYQIDKIN